MFDTNKYAHDPRGDFNWSIVDTGSFDYAADAWGYTTGLTAEWYRGSWTVRVGAFNLSKIPNGETLETRFQQYQLDAEVEHRHRIAGRDGAVRITLFRDRGSSGGSIMRWRSRPVLATHPTRRWSARAEHARG